jgi:uncharacterized membrane protein YiaA
MSDSLWSSQIFGMISILAGLPILLWSWRLWRRPSSLPLDSLIYRLFYAYSRVWTRKRKYESDRLTDREIKRYARMNFILGVMLVVVGILEIIIGVL